MFLRQNLTTTNKINATSILRSLKNSLGGKIKVSPVFLIFCYFELGGLLMKSTSKTNSNFGFQNFSACLAAR